MSPKSKNTQIFKSKAKFSLNKKENKIKNTNYKQI
jgi:hypothetical protein